ncbi:MAG TPA: hypothetical protein VNH18_26525, partial [Bryobacteraceae bacterium]|nr:hypothetical protein [Bryobacteraceae bacterium]
NPVTDFSGTWNLSQSRSDLRDPLGPLDSVISVTQTGNVLTLSARGNQIVYPLDRHTEKSRIGETQYSIAAKWEGSALLANIIVSGQNYTVFERWSRSKGGNTLTISRTVTRPNGESESTLVYENPAFVSEAPPQAPPTNQSGSPTLIRRTPPPPSPSPQSGSFADEEFVVTAGTHILLRLTNAVNTKRTAPGDKVYLQTAAPIFINHRMVIPPGTYVTGIVTEARRAGRVKGRSSLNLQFDSMTLANGTVRDLRSRPGSVDSAGNLDRKEGRIQGDSSKGQDVRTVATTSAAGAGLGSIIGIGSGHTGMGAGIGGAAGAAAGLAGILATRGQDVVLPAGTTMELVLDRDLHFNSDDLQGVR